MNLAKPRLPNNPDTIVSRGKKSVCFEAVCLRDSLKLQAHRRLKQ